MIENLRSKSESELKAFTDEQLAGRGIQVYNIMCSVYLRDD